MQARAYRAASERAGAYVTRRGAHRPIIVIEANYDDRRRAVGGCQCERRAADRISLWDLIKSLRRDDVRAGMCTCSVRAASWMKW